MKMLELMARKRVTMPIGSPTKPVYTPKVLDDGRIVLKQTATRDWYAMIQAERDSCNIEMLVERFTAGDLSALSRVQGTYGDFTQAPKTYAELLQTVMDAKELFDSLPGQKKEAFNNSFEQFFATTGSADWFSALGLVKQGVAASDPPPAPVEKEVKE